MQWFLDFQKECERKEEAKRLALTVLKANPLHIEPWMTARDRCDWMPFFCNAGAAGCMGCWGVREALRFRVASARCLRALEADGEWRALTFLGRSRMGLEARGCHGAGLPSAQEFAAAYEKVMCFCLLEPSFEVRLLLGGVGDELADEYRTHKALRFDVKHASSVGAVADVQMGYWDNDHASDDGWADADWSDAPPDIFNQFESCADSIHLVVQYKGKQYTLAEAFANEGSRGISFDLVNTLSPLMQIHSCGDRQFCCEVIFHVEAYIPTATFTHFVGLCQRPSFPALALGDALLPAIDTPPTLDLVGSAWSSHDIDSYPSKHNFSFHGTMMMQPLTSNSTDLQAAVPARERARLALASMLRPAAEAHDENSNALRLLSELIVQQIGRLTEANGAVPRDLEASVVGQLASLVEIAGRDGNRFRGLSADDALAAVADMANPDAVIYEASISPMGDWEWMEDTFEVDRVSLSALDSLGRVRFQLHAMEMPSARLGHRPARGDTRHATGMNGKVSVYFTSCRLRLTFLDGSIAESVVGARGSSAE